MRKGKSSTTLVGIRQLLLRIAMMVSLVGLGGVLVKTGAVAQTTSSRVLTLDATDRQLPSGRPAVGAGRDAFSVGPGSEGSAPRRLYWSLELQRLRRLFG